MLLYHLTSQDIWEDIQQTGFFKTDGRHIERYLLTPYKWIRGQLSSRISPAPKGIKFPVWAWFRYDGIPRPDLRKMSWQLPQGELGVMLELDIPDNQVLLSDFQMWHCAINHTYLNTEADYDYNTNHTQQEIEESWVHMFDLKPYSEWTTNGKVEDIQAIFWSFTLSQVKRSWTYTGRER